jgi:uncharacterized membrane protein YeaQ/YmgE (transglycosylase-associated protein family)
VAAGAAGAGATVAVAADAAHVAVAADAAHVYARSVLIIGIILFGMLVGAGAQLILRRSTSGIDWPTAFASGLIGSFVGGLLSSLIAGDGLSLRPSGIIGSLVGAIIVTLAWQWWRGRTPSAT